MKDLLKKGLALGLGVAVASKEQIEKVVDDLVKKGEVSTAESKELVNELIVKGEEGQKELQRVIREQFNKLLSELNIPTKEEIKRLEERLAKLESKENEQ
ncbi:MAG: phasin family protein [Desulfitobacteriaceae bacterium]